MQFSKKVSQLSRSFNVDPKDVFFAMLTTSGATAAEAFAVIYRPATTTNATLATKASQYIGAKPGLQRLIAELDHERNPDAEEPPKRAGRPRKEKQQADEDSPSLDYTDKDAVLKELARIAERSEKESDRLAAIREISALQRMKQEAAVEDEKRVTFYIPLTYERATELHEYLQRYYADRDVKV